jgi:hypothetical protein
LVKETKGKRKEEGYSRSKTEAGKSTAISRDHVQNYATVTRTLSVQKNMMQKSLVTDS